jgi:phosphoribosylformylglycinamidine synthase subunit PurS
MYKVKVDVMLKEDVLDPQGKTVQKALDQLGYEGVDHMKIGRYVEFNCDGASSDDVNKKVVEICSKVLSNPVIEKYEYHIEKV